MLVLVRWQSEASKQRIQVWVTNPVDNSVGTCFLPVHTLLFNTQQMECFISDWAVADFSRGCEYFSYHWFYRYHCHLCKCFLCLNMLRVWDIGMHSPTQGGLLPVLAGEVRRVIRGSAVASSLFSAFIWKLWKLRNVQIQNCEINKGVKWMFWRAVWDSEKDWWHLLLSGMQILE